ncbi:radical SAM family heme chaperone HemW [Anthocerotibacter panamensis]|uniref:radical SAM family heme chaperone HemW n=1 Tax=Anthocerotibacter panamensis TaxID=2857077 RepID=UPI001C404C85|nr:radical SAM family heme chaperone HemW [Anthocerotibacter panamensis]
MTTQIIGRTTPQTRSNWPQALYLHIPFCPTHCHYCDFAVTVGTDSLVERYVQYLLREMAFTPTSGQKLTSVYLGGGTPSLLSPDQVERILDRVREHFGVEPGAEVTLEANPGTMDRTKLSAYRSAGVNRISLGVQAFQEELLKVCGRSHGVKAIYQAVDAIRDAGLTNFSLDLIFGLPGQTFEHWQDSLAAALALQPDHLSAYDLILEEHTPFGRRYQPGVHPLPEEEATVQMYLALIEQFQGAGYEHYEIASLARPGYQSRHNRVYWHNRAYYGLGVGATGYVHYERVTRPRHLVDYFAWVERGIFTREPAVGEEEELGETLMLGLRLVEGVNLISLTECFGSTAVAQKLGGLTRVKAQGLVLEAEGLLKLVYPEGFLLANEVLQWVV